MGKLGHANLMSVFSLTGNELWRYSCNSGLMAAFRRIGDGWANRRIHDFRSLLAKKKLVIDYWIFSNKSIIVVQSSLLCSGCLSDRKSNTFQNYYDYSNSNLTTGV